MTKAAHLIVVGKLKESSLVSIENTYLERLIKPNLIIHELKSTTENVEKEGEEIIKEVDAIKSKNSGTYLILLTENGQSFNSVDWSKWLYQLFEKNLTPIFVISGAQGFSPAVLNLSNAKVSLSEMTFPHKLARIIFIEQYYRAQTLKNNHPYHY